MKNINNNAGIIIPSPLPMPPLPVDKKKLNEGRRGSLDLNSNQNIKIIQNRNNSSSPKNQKNNTSPPKNQKNNISPPKNQKNNTSPPKNQKNNTSPPKNQKNNELNVNSDGNTKQKLILMKLKNIEGKDIDSNGLEMNNIDAHEEIERGSEGGYLSHHIKINKAKVQNKKIDKSNSRDKNGEDDKKQNNNENDDDDDDVEEKDEDDNTVKSKAYSVNSRGSQNTNNSKRISVGGKASIGALILRPQKLLSNIQQIKIAINHVCLAGAHYDVQRAEAVRAVESYSVLTDPESTPVTQFLVLFYDSNPLSFRGIYTVHPFTGKINNFISFRNN